MESEKLALEVSATRAGLTPVSPRVLRGVSGVEHSFTLLFSGAGRFYAFDFYDTVTEVELVRSYAKKFDSKASVNIVCLGGSVSKEVQSLASEYEIRILRPEATENFFALEPLPPRRTFG